MSLFEEVGKAYEGFKDEIYLDHEKVPTVGVGFNLRNPDVLREVLKQFGYSTDSLSESDFNNLQRDLLRIFEPKDWTETNKDDKISEVNDLLKEYKEKMDDAADEDAAHDTFVFKDKDGKSGFEDSSIPKTANEMKPVFTEAIKDFEQKAVARIKSLLDYDDLADAQAVWDGLDQSKKDSLLSLIFNGGPRIMGTKLAGALRDKNWADAYFEIVYGSNKPKDYDGDGKTDGRSYGLQLRRTAEGAKFIESLSADDKKKLFDKLKDNKTTIEKYLDSVVDLPSSGGYRELSEVRHDKLFNDLNNLMDDLRSDLAAEGIIVNDVNFKSSKVIYSPHLNDVDEPARVDPVPPQEPTTPPKDEGPKDPPTPDPKDPAEPSTPLADPIVSIKETNKDGYTLIEVYFNDDSGTSKILMAVPDSSPEGSGDPGYLFGFPNENDHTASILRNPDGTVTYRFIDKNGNVATDLSLDSDKKTINLNNPLKGEDGKWERWEDAIKKNPIPDPEPPELPPPPPRDPLALDLNGDGIVNTLPMSSGIHFDLDNSGFAEQTSWVAPEDGLLVLDRNNNNFIDGGAELFGTETLLGNGEYAKHGFEALAEFDVNRDGVINSSDAIYSSVRVWRDANSNGLADSGELKILGELNIKSIGTVYSDIAIRDVNNVEHREAGLFTYNNSTQGITNTLWFESDRRITTPVTELQGNITIPETIKKLPDAVGFGNTYSLHHAMTVDTTGELQKKVQWFSENDYFYGMSA